MRQSTVSVCFPLNLNTYILHINIGLQLNELGKKYNKRKSFWKVLSFWCQKHLRNTFPEILTIIRKSPNGFYLLTFSDYTIFFLFIYYIHLFFYIFYSLCIIHFKISNIKHSNRSLQSQNGLNKKKLGQCFNIGFIRCF